MENFLIEDVKCDIANSSPMMCIVIASVKYHDGDSSKWLNLSEIDGIPCFSLTSRDVFDELIENDWSDAFLEEMHRSFISELEGLALGEYDEIFDSIYVDDVDPCVIKLIRYIIAVTRCDYDEMEDVKAKAIGKRIDDVDTITTDVEDDYLFDKGE